MPVMMDVGAAGAPPRDDQAVYQGGGVTGIRDLAERLGATVQWDPTTGRVSVNGTNVPYSSNLNGTTSGAVHDIAAAAGGKVVQNPDGSYTVSRTATTPQSTMPTTTPTPATPVTGNPTSLPNVPPPQLQAPVQGGTPPTSMIRPVPTVSTDALQQVAQLAQSGNQTAAGQALVNMGYTAQQALQALAGMPAGGTAPGTQAPAATTGQPMAATPAYTPAPIDYGGLQDRANLMAQDWAAPSLQALKDAAAKAQAQFDLQRGYVDQDLADNIANLRAGETAREQRINEDMNRRGDAIYNSGIRYAGVAQQQQNAYNKELGLTQSAAKKLGRLADSLGLKLTDIANKGLALAQRQGDKALLSYQQLADKAESQQFKNRQLAWQMYVQGSRLDLDGQKMANELWIKTEQLRSTDERAQAQNELKAAIANGTLKQKYAAMQQDQQQFDTRLAFDQAKAADQSEVNRLKLALDAEKFDWDQQKFVISEGNKVEYQNALLSLRERGLLNTEQYQLASLDVRRGELDVSTARVLETERHNKAAEQESQRRNQATEEETQRHNQATELASQAGSGSAAFKSALAEVGSIGNPMNGNFPTEKARAEAAMAIVGRWQDQLSEADRQALAGYFKAKGWDKFFK